MKKEEDEYSIHMEDLRKYAKKYDSWGWIVLPFAVDKKAPLIPWKNSDKKNSLHIFERILDNQIKYSKTINLGIVCGKKSGITIIDIDLKDDGMDTYYRLIKKFGSHNSRMSRTGTGGLHIFFNYDPEIKTTVKVNGVGIDIRNDKSVIVLPPSINSSTGNKYKWINEKKEILDIPKWFKDWILQSVKFSI